jgi:acetyl-CoA carboxylase biotin carboxyl carrier protein
MASREVRSPTSGMVSVVQRQSGEAVAAGEELFFIECMKMEIPVVCEYAGRLVVVKVKPGDVVSEDQVLAVIET